MFVIAFIIFIPVTPLSPLALILLILEIAAVYNLTLAPCRKRDPAKMPSA